MQFSEQQITQVLELGCRSVGFSTPNPAVGALLLKNKKIIGEGSTEVAGKKHAEIVCIENAKKNGFNIKGASMLVTLEPCSHYGRTPPCTEEIIKSGIKDVIILSKDPNPEVNGIDILRKARIHVKVFSENLTDYQKWLLKWSLGGFYFSVNKKRPLRILKWAETKSSWIAPNLGSSGIISDIESTSFVHGIRSRMPVIFPSGTVLSDFPNGTARIMGTAQKPFTGWINYLINTHARVSLRGHFLSKELLNHSDFINYANRQEALEGKQFWLVRNQLVANLAKKILPKSKIKLIPRIDHFEFDLWILNNGYTHCLIESGPSLGQILLDNSWPDLLIKIKSSTDPFLQGKKIFINSKKYTKVLEFSLGNDQIFGYLKQSNKIDSLL